MQRYPDTTKGGEFIFCSLLFAEPSTQKDRKDRRTKGAIIDTVTNTAYTDIKV